jgi:HSP20 family protein
MAATLAPKKENQTRRSLWHPLGMIRQELQDFLAPLLDEEADWPMLRVMPALDMSETADSIQIRMDVPGVDAKDVDVQLNNNVLTVRGEKKEEREEKGKTWHRVERREGSFSRSVVLPCGVKEGAIDARCRDGVLTITLPKCDEAKSKKIDVKS